MTVFIFQEPRLFSYFSLLKLNYLTRHSPSDIHKEFLSSIIKHYASHSRRETNEYMLSKYNVVSIIKVAKITRSCNCNIWNGSVTVERMTMT
jgi:hypothetical protein